MIGIVICHKSLAFELLNTVDAIIGHHKDLYAFSNEKYSSQDLVTLINSFLDSVENSEEVIFMVDLRGGNCWSVAKMIAHTRPRTAVLSGVNLPVLLSFLIKKEKLPFYDLIRTLENDAHRGVNLE